MNIISEVKPGDEILLIDGFYPRTGKAYGLTNGKWGYTLRVKVEDEGEVYFTSISTVNQKPEGTVRKIGAYKI